MVEIFHTCNYAKTLKGNDSLLFAVSQRGINIIPEVDGYHISEQSAHGLQKRQ